MAYNDVPGQDGTYVGPSGPNNRNPLAIATSTDAQASLGGPIPIAYGPVRAIGNLVRMGSLPDKSRTAFTLLAEGEWDGIDRIFINRKLRAVSSDWLHFHSGTDGVLGAGLAETSDGGDQAVDQLFLSFPNDPRLTFSRIAWMAMNIQPDPGAPNADLEWIGDFRTMKVRTFDNAGTQTGYAYSENYAWQWLDAICRFRLKPEFLIDPATGAEALTAGEKARIDFASWKDFADRCDEVLANGEYRFHGGVFVADRRNLSDLYAQFAAASCAWIDEPQGKIQARMDKPRTSTFVMTAKHYVSRSAKPNEQRTAGAPNRFTGNYRDVNFRANSSIAAISRTLGVVTVQTTAVHPFLSGDAIEVVGVADNSYNVNTIAITIIDTTHFTYYANGADGASAGGFIGTPSSRMLIRNPYRDNVAHQKAIGQRGVGLAVMPVIREVVIDFGFNTWERVTRLLDYAKVRALGSTAEPYQAPKDLTLSAWENSVDDAGNALLEQLNGDRITIDRSVIEEYAGDYEIIDHTLRGSSDESAGMIEYNLRPYTEAGMSDAGDADPTIGVVPDSRRVDPITTVDGAGNTIVDNSTPLGPQGSMIPGVGTQTPFAFDVSMSQRGRVALQWEDTGSTDVTKLPSYGGTITITKSTKDHDGGVQPAAPTLTAVASGAKFARTQYVRVGLVRIAPDGTAWLAGISPESNIALTAGQLVKVTSPAAVASYDGWVPLVCYDYSGATKQNYVVGSMSAPIAFGTDWTEDAVKEVNENSLFASDNLSFDHGNVDYWKFTGSGTYAATAAQVHSLPFSLRVDVPAGGTADIDLCSNTAATVLLRAATVAGDVVKLGMFIYGATLSGTAGSLRALDGSDNPLTTAALNLVLGAWAYTEAIAVIASNGTVRLTFRVTSTTGACVLYFDTITFKKMNGATRYSDFEANVNAPRYGLVLPNLTPGAMKAYPRYQLDIAKVVVGSEYSAALNKVKAQETYADGNVPMMDSLTPLTWTVPAYGSGTTSGGSGGGGFCQKKGAPGFSIEVGKGTRYVRNEAPEENWCRVRYVNGDEKHVSPGHRYLTYRGLVKAAALERHDVVHRVRENDWMPVADVLSYVDKDGIAVQVEILEAGEPISEFDDGHHYGAGGYESHNAKP
jgi:hypothetical protein